MPTPFTPELLSAYLDGELSDDERQLVEETLREQPEIQEQLTQLRTLSQRVQNLPEIRAPEDLHTTVLAELSRQGSVALPTAANRPAKLPQRPLWRQTATWISSVAALLVIGVSVLWLNHKIQFAQIADTQAPANSSFATTENTEALSGDRLESVALSESVTQLDVDSSIVMSAGNGQANSPEFFNSELQDNSLSFSLIASESDSITMPSAEALPKLELLTAELQQKLESYQEVPEPGEELALATMYEGTPVIVDFTVVDVQETMKDVQFLLKKHAAVPLNEATLESQLSVTDEFTVVAFDIAEPELEAVLNNVEALQAVMYIQPEAPVVEANSDDVINLSVNGGVPQPAVARGLNEPAAVNEPAKNQPSQNVKTTLAQDANRPFVDSDKLAPFEQNFRFVLSNGLVQSGRLPVDQAPQATSPGTQRSVTAPAAASGFGGGREQQAQPGASKVDRSRTKSVSKEETKESVADDGVDKRSDLPTPAQVVELRSEAPKREGRPELSDAAKPTDDLRQVERKIRAVLLLRQLDE